MKAILLGKKGAPDNLRLGEYPLPVVKDGFVLIEIKAFGINHADIYMTRGDWGDTADIIGIECVGLIEDDPSGKFQKGQKVATLVGGMGRSINGGYAQYMAVPAANVIPFESNLPWNQLAAIPESYATAWALLTWTLNAREDETLLVRGGTSTVGLASIVLAKKMGLRVIATTRRPVKASFLREMGADAVVIDEGKISHSVAKLAPGGVDKVIELVGNSTLADSLECIRPMGSIVVAGFLGGLSPIENFHPVFQIPRCIRLTALASAFLFGQPGFEYDHIPLQQIISDIEAGRMRNILRRTFPAEEIVDAHKMVESGDTNGKIVIQW